MFYDLVLYEIPCGDVGRRVGTALGTHTDELKNPVVLRFDNVKSIDIVMDELLKIREEFVKSES